MKYNDMTNTVKRRFRQNRICPLCNRKIGLLEEIEYSKQRAGKFIIYSFYHRGCDNNGEKQETESERKESEVTKEETTKI